MRVSACRGDKETGAARSGVLSDTTRSFKTSPPFTNGSAVPAGAGFATFESEAFAGCLPFTASSFVSFVRFTSPLAFCSTFKRTFSMRRSSLRTTSPCNSDPIYRFTRTRPILAATPGANPLGFPMETPSTVTPSDQENFSVSMRASLASCSLIAATTLGRTIEFTNMGTIAMSATMRTIKARPAYSSHFSRRRRGFVGVTESTDGFMAGIRILGFGAV